MERLIAEALCEAGVSFVHDDPVSHLDFYLPDLNIYIEVKQMHSMRIADQMARVDNVIVAQGRKAVEALAGLIAAGGLSS